MSAYIANTIPLSYEEVQGSIQKLAEYFMAQHLIRIVEPKIAVKKMIPRQSRLTDIAYDIELGLYNAREGDIHADEIDEDGYYIVAITGEDLKKAFEVET